MSRDFNEKNNLKSKQNLIWMENTTSENWSKEQRPKNQIHCFIDN